MVLDTSALVAILFDEPPRPALVRALAADPRRLVSAATVVEAGIVVEARRGERAGVDLDVLLHRAGVRVVALDADQADLARSAWRRFGKGRHAAGLDLGDCFAYAAAVATGEPLLGVGDGFPATDVEVVLI